MERSTTVIYTEIDKKSAEFRQITNMMKADGYVAAVSFGISFAYFPAIVGTVVGAVDFFRRMRTLGEKKSERRELSIELGEASREREDRRYVVRDV